MMDVFIDKISSSQLTQSHPHCLCCCSFATREPNGLLLYNGRYNEKHDFLSLEVVDGEVIFSFSLGTVTTRVSASLPGGVHDGNWHTVAVEYYYRVSLCTVTLALVWCLLASLTIVLFSVYVSNIISIFFLVQSATISLDNCDTALAVRFGNKIGEYHCANTTAQILDSR